MGYFDVAEIKKGLFTLEQLLFLLILVEKLLYINRTTAPV